MFMPIRQSVAVFFFISCLFYFNQPRVSTSSLGVSSFLLLFRSSSSLPIFPPPCVVPVLLSRTLLPSADPPPMSQLNPHFSRYLQVSAFFPNSSPSSPFSPGGTFSSFYLFLLPVSISQTDLVMPISFRPQSNNFSCKRTCWPGHVLLQEPIYTSHARVVPLDLQSSSVCSSLCCHPLHRAASPPEPCWVPPRLSPPLCWCFLRVSLGFAWCPEARSNTAAILKHTKEGPATGLHPRALTCAHFYTRTAAVLTSLQPTSPNMK